MKAFLREKWQKLRQKLCRHRYQPCYEVVTVHGKHWATGRAKFFQYECSLCGKPTGWLKWRYHQAFLDKHNPDWSKRNARR